MCHSRIHPLFSHIYTTTLQLAELSTFITGGAVLSTRPQERLGAASQSWIWGEAGCGADVRGEIGSVVRACVLCVRACVHVQRQ
jgi:hypothetical protein